MRVLRALILAKQKKRLQEALLRLGLWRVLGL